MFNQRAAFLSRGIFTALTVLFLACTSPTADLRPDENLLPSQSDLNVIVVSFDALRADALGIYGYPRSTSPNIDKFGQQALVFDKAFVAAPVTPTSFASAFTGQLPFRVFRKWQLVTNDTLASRFATAGFHTAAFLNNSQLTSERGFGLGFEHYQHFNSIDDKKLLEKTLEWLAQPRQADNFFLWLHFLTPHSPYDYREESAHLYDNNYSGKFEKTSTQLFETDDPKEIDRIRSLYDGEIYFADQLFGQLLEYLKNNGYMENSIVILTADHGEEFLERGYFQHRHLHLETIQVPLIIHHPNGSRGERTSTLYNNVDLFPTLMAISGLEQESTPLDGWNLSAPLDDDRPIVSVAMTDGKYRGMSLQTREKKIILDCLPERKLSFFDLQKDPQENINLMNSRRREANEMLQLMTLICQKDPCDSIREALQGVEATEGLSPETIEGLKALGYIQ